MTPSLKFYTDSVSSQTVEPLKACPKCRTPKAHGEFRGSSKNRDGLQGWCKSCANATLRERADTKMEEQISSDKYLYSQMSEIDRPKPKKCSHQGCEHHGLLQSPEYFARRVLSRDGLALRCRICELREKRNPSPPQDKTQYQNLWYETNKVELNKRTKEWREANPEECKRLYVERRFRQYGVTPEWYARQLALQGGGCAICGSLDPKSNGNTFHVDHDHSCCNASKGCHACDKCRRGLLCGPCNTRLGHLENLAWKRQAIAYLNKYSKKPTVDPDQESLFDC